MTLLTDLKLKPAAVPNLPATLRNKLLYFLLRWEAYADALDYYKDNLDETLDG